MRGHIRIAMAWSLWFRPGSAKFRFGRPDEPDAPRINDPLDPIVPMGPNRVHPGRWDGEAPGQTGAVPTQRDLELIMSRVEEAVGAVVDAFGNAPDGDGLSVAVSGMLATPACTWPSEEDSTRFIETASATAECTSVDLEPKTVLPSESFSACTSYAKRIASCASATSSFYSLEPTDQASCVCYSTPATRGCTGNTVVQVTVAPTLATAAVDESARTCHEFFSIQGYDHVAQMLSGRAGNQTVLGAGFCRKIDDEIKRQTNLTRGLNRSLESTEYTNCQGLLIPSEERGLGIHGHGVRSVRNTMAVVLAVLLVVLPLFLYP